MGVRGIFHRIPRALIIGERYANLQPPLLPQHRTSGLLDSRLRTNDGQPLPPLPAVLASRSPRRRSVSCVVRDRRLCDTRPFRGRRAIAYAGCMTVVRTAAIESVYSSGLSHRSGLWLRSPTFEIYEHLVQFSWEAGHGLAHSGARCSRCSRCSNEAPGLLVVPATRCSGSGADCTPCSGPLDSRLRGNDGRRAGMRGSCLRRNDGGIGLRGSCLRRNDGPARFAIRAARSPARSR